MSGLLVRFPLERCRPPASSGKAYPPDAFVAQVYKVQRFPARYRLRARETTPGAKRGWPLGTSEASYDTAARFLKQWQESAYAGGLRWIPEDFSGDFPQYQQPLRQADGVIIYDFAAFERVRGEYQI
jgi:hypothetical protein